MENQELVTRGSGAFRSDALSGRIAVVTGAGGGIGGAIVSQLAGMGASVALIDLKEVEVPAGIQHRSLTLGCDISDENAVATAADLVIARFGRCDILVNNAAILPEPVALEDLSLVMWDRVVGTNLRGAFLCAKHFCRPMLAQGSGSVINVASVAATVPNAVGPYGPSKAAILALTRQLAVEWGPRGVRANAVSPGLIRTPMSEIFYQDAGLLAARTQVVALRRIGVAEDIADAIGFFASDASSYINEQEIVVDGGFLHTALINLAGKFTPSKLSPRN